MTTTSPLQDFVEQVLTHEKISTPTPPTILCNVCSPQRIFNSKQNYNYHLKHTHGNPERFFCRACGKSFALKTSKTRHEKTCKHVLSRPQPLLTTAPTLSPNVGEPVYTATMADVQPSSSSTSTLPTSFMFVPCQSCRDRNVEYSKFKTDLVTKIAQNTLDILSIINNHSL
jgi:ribosomal protein S27E